MNGLLHDGPVDGRNDKAVDCIGGLASRDCIEEEEGRRCGLDGRKKEARKDNIIRDAEEEEEQQQAITSLFVLCSTCVYCRTFVKPKGCLSGRLQ